jgi:tetratricopeptide (TPR) repeat protein
VVDALADGRSSEARTLLAEGGMEAPHGLAAEILKPWAAAAVGDWASALSTSGGLTRPVEGRMDAASLAENLNQAGRLELLERAGRFAEADALIQTMEVEEAPLRQVLKQGAYLERRKRADDAMKLYGAALTRRASDPSLLAALERVKGRRAPPPLPSLKAGAGEALIIPAMAFAGGRQYETALAYLRMSLHLDPSSDEAWLVLGDVLAAAGDVEGARRAYSAPEPRAPRFAASRARLALMLDDAGRTSEALEVIEKAAAAAPKDGDVLTTYASLLSKQNRFDEAAAVFDRLTAGDEGVKDWRVLYMRGGARERAGRWPEAEQDFQQALKIAPEEPELLNALGYGWIDRGMRLQEALAMVERAARARPRSGAIVDSLGWAHYRLGNYAEAVRHLERAVELEPADPTINDHLGDAYWRVGRRTEAQFQWTRALSLKPEPALKAAAEAKLASPAGPDVVRPAEQAQQAVPPRP